MLLKISIINRWHLGKKKRAMVVSFRSTKIPRILTVLHHLPMLVEEEVTPLTLMHVKYVMKQMQTQPLYHVVTILHVSNAQ